MRLPEGGTVVRIPLEVLSARMARAPALSNAMVALFGQELARKVADSVPMDRAAMARDVTRTETAGDAGMSPTLPVAFITMSLR